MSALVFAVQWINFDISSRQSYWKQTAKFKVIFIYVNVNQVDESVRVDSGFGRKLAVTDGQPGP